MLETNERVSKQEGFFKSYFKKHNFKYAKKAFNLVKEHHNGVRRNGAQERSHMFEVAGKCIRDFHGSLTEVYLEKLIVCTLLHDFIEDINEAEKILLEKGFPADIIKTIKLVSKKSDFTKTEENYIEYHTAIGTDLIATIAKAYDRIHNLNSCIRVFKPEKKLDYIEETKKYIIPNLKVARRTYNEKYHELTGIILELKNLCISLEYIVELELRLKKIGSED